MNGGGVNGGGANGGGVNGPGPGSGEDRFHVGASVAGGLGAFLSMLLLTPAAYAVFVAVPYVGPLLAVLIAGLPLIVGVLLLRGQSDARERGGALGIISGWALGIILLGGFCVSLVNSFQGG